MKIPNNLVHAAFFFTDIVGLSDPIMSTETQTAKIQGLNQMIQECNTYKKTKENEMFVLPTGDGMAIGFKDGLEQPLDLAIEFHKKLKKYNENKTKIDKILVRIGCHVGPVFLVKDILGNLNFWGQGIILARRTMDVGDDWHILLTSTMAESLLEVSLRYKEILYPLHDYEIKHDQKILIYSAHGESFGNKSSPKKGLIEKSIINEKTLEQNQKITFEHVKFELRLQDSDNRIFHRRTYKITNHFEDPIYEITTGIITSVKKSFYDLDVKAFNDDVELQIKSINVDTDFIKEFTIKFEHPVFENEDMEFTITYASEAAKNEFNNKFLINAKKFDLIFSYSSNLKIKNPKAKLIQNETEKQINIEPNIKRGIFTQVYWDTIKDISIGDEIELIWE
ncbi:adenylate/guanylate cyclase domain-containing protein [Nitrosopumilus cobalaminigenes]|nr:adenylate/guanylate cyclase domain-containing protein [Nitrosopumilus cobalaminigenes]